MPRMNGSEPRIEIFQPLDEAFELMKKILFQPFDLKKWLVIGFAAWLSNLGSGGYNFRFNRGDWKGVPWFQGLDNTINQIPHWILLTGLGVIIALVFALMIVFAWLRARGRFLLIDCIVKNRGAIAEPWRDFRKVGNSYFLFSLLVCLAFLIFAGLLSLPLVVPVIRDAAFPRTHSVCVICAIATWVFVMLLLVLAWSLIANFMVPITYRQRCRPSEAFDIVGRLIAGHPEILLYCLFLILLALATVIVACVATCATCCIAAIPYIGTVILLPVFVLLRSFSLLFLRQFGSDYDVWANFIPPEFSTILLSPPAPPPSTSPLNS